MYDKQKISILGQRCFHSEKIDKSQRYGRKAESRVKGMNEKNENFSDKNGINFLVSLSKKDKGKYSRDLKG